MLNFINSWAQGIILAIIIATIIEIILPEGNNKKYVKTIIGIYILFVIVYPVISKISNKNINIQAIIDNTTSQMSEYETNTIAIQTNSYIEETYKQSLEEDMKKKVNEKGYNINFLDLYIETEDGEKYGQINNIVMEISKLEKSGANITESAINRIESVEIKISNNNTNKNINIQQENISNEEINNLKEYINTTYMIEKEKIHINE